MEPLSFGGDFLVAAVVTFRAAALVRAEPLKGIARACLAGEIGQERVSTTDHPLMSLRERSCVQECRQFS